MTYEDVNQGNTPPEAATEADDELDVIEDKGLIYSE